MRSPIPTAARIMALVGGGAGVLSARLDWTISGSARRNSYASLRAAQRLGLEQLTPFRIVWFLVPVAVLATAALLTARTDRAAGIVGLLAGLVLVAFGGGVLLTPVASGMGPWLSCTAGLVTVGASGVLVAQGGGKS